MLIKKPPGWRGFFISKSAKKKLFLLCCDFTFNASFFLSLAFAVFHFLSVFFTASSHFLVLSN